ncbi:unnamed protein product [Porites evermanni]|uniref:CTHRC1 C-terminal domain-containing protein n=1 Tax=Porites evermanni TaxID=104178 RepID=A0ABN8PTX5_9CNID|nr:unnamed protein product [Porites evermanni]
MYVPSFQECDFTKKRSDTYLRVVYMGNTRITGCSSCCRRWYFTFNDVECRAPATIDGLVYQSTNINIHRSSNIEGYCGGIASGKVRVGFHVGNCKAYPKSADALTSWNAISRIIIEEVEPPVNSCRTNLPRDNAPSGLKNHSNRNWLVTQKGMCSYAMEMSVNAKLCMNTFECDFTKKRSDTYLRVVYMGNTRITGCSSCCKRWYFTFNDVECRAPATIDGLVYQSTNINIHRSANIEGYCGGIASGKVRVGFHVGNCKAYPKSVDALTSWNAISRIIIEEVEPPVL